LVRAFDPWPVAYTTLNGADDGRRLRVWRTRLRPDRAPAGAGTVIQADRSGLLVATGGGALELVEVQAPGGRRMLATEFLNAHPIAPGTRLGHG
jgi:methionyl-tRNA formyltransferase